MWWVNIRKPSHAWVQNCGLAPVTCNDTKEDGRFLAARYVECRQKQLGWAQVETGRASDLGGCHPADGDSHRPMGPFSGGWMCFLGFLFEAMKHEGRRYNYRVHHGTQWMPPLGLLETLPRLEGLGSIGSEETRWVESCSAEKGLQKNIVQHGSPSTRFGPKLCARDWGGKDCCMFLMYIYI